MKKILFALFMTAFGFITYGQSFDGYIVTNANDTIHCKFFVQTNLFNKKIFYATYVYNKVKILTEKGEKIKYYPKDIKCFYISGTTDGNFKFVSFKYDNYKHFYHEVVGDRLSYYRLYNKDNQYKGVNQTYKEFIFKDDFFLELGIFNTRKNLAKLIKDNKEIYDKWMDENGYYKLRDAFNIINQYNNFYKK
jgi:glycosyltransferase involved in cell wall biosynthesis